MLHARPTKSGYFSPGSTIDADGWDHVLDFILKKFKRPLKYLGRNWGVQR